MTRLFISYSRSDQLFALDLNDALNQRGFETWFFARDGKDIKDGEYAQVLDAAMASCDAMVYLVTPRSLSSPNRRIEMKRFLEANKPILPLVLEPTAIPDELNREYAVHHMDNFAETAERVNEGIIRMIAAGKSAAGGEKPLIFISYPRSETSFAKRINTALLANGYRTWIYSEDYDPSQERESQIVGALQQAALQIVVITQRALRSPAIALEYDVMAMMHKPIIPVMLYPVPDLPKTLQNIPPVDFQGDFQAAFDDLLATIQKYEPQRESESSNQADARKIFLLHLADVDGRKPETLVTALQAKGYKVYVCAHDQETVFDEALKHDIDKCNHVIVLMWSAILPKLRDALSPFRLIIEYAMKQKKNFVPVHYRAGIEMSISFNRIDWDLDVAEKVPELQWVGIGTGGNPESKAQAAQQQVTIENLLFVLETNANQMILGGQKPTSSTNSMPLTDGLSHHIFLSYKRMDGEIMRRVRDDLRMAGFIVWTDELIEKGTPQWQREIEKAIRNTATLLCLLSPEAAQSDYVREELAAAKLFKKPIFLALVRGTREQCFIYGFVNAQSTDLRDDTSYAREFPLLVEAIRKRV